MSEPRTGLDALWHDLVADALASDGPIRDADVKNAVVRYQGRIEAEARAEGYAAALADVEKVRREREQELRSAQYLAAKDGPDSKWHWYAKGLDSALAPFRDLDALTPKEPGRG